VGSELVQSWFRVDSEYGEGDTQGRKNLRTYCLIAIVVFGANAQLGAQAVLDRVIARVEGNAIMLSDARAALRLGLVERSADADQTLAAMRWLIDRRLVLGEVARFAPAEPPAAALQTEVTAIKARAGSPADLAALEKTTGYGEQQIRDIARDNLRIQAYLNQRFGSSVQPNDDEVGQYYRTHLDDFTVNGRVIPFVEAEPTARQRAAAERRRTVISDWMRDLRQRADVVELYRPR
jgi:hypothetical protein